MLAVERAAIARVERAAIARMKRAALVFAAICAFGMTAQRTTPARAADDAYSERPFQMPKDPVGDSGAHDEWQPPAWLSPVRRVRWGGFMQADWIAMDQRSQDEIDTTGQPLNDNRFVLRRARIRAELDRGIFVGALEIDANTVNGLQMRPIDAEISVRWPTPPLLEHRGDYDFMLTMGLFQTPFGYETQELDPVRPFLERSNMINAFFPGVYDLGARLRGRYKFLNYAVGVMNGDPIGEKAFAGRDPNKSKDLVFRVGVKTDVARGVDVDVGFSGLTGSGFHEGTPTTKDQLVWRDANEDGIVDPSEIQVIAGTAATPSQIFKRFAVGADARVSVRVPWLGNLQVRGEIIRASNVDRGMFIADPVSVGRDLREFGYSVGVAQDVTRFGLIGIRYDHYDPDTDAAEQQGLSFVPRDNSVGTWAFVGGLKLPQERGPFNAGRLLFEYDKNTNALGRGANGLPTTLASDTAILRAEITY